MNLHEYQGKEILNSFGVRIQRGIVASNPKEAVDAAKQLTDYTGTSWYVVKAQVHAGGRGKGGGVKLAKSINDVETISNDIIGMNLITPQTTAEGKKVHQVLICEDVYYPGDSEPEEYYMSVLLNKITPTQINKKIDETLSRKAVASYQYNNAIKEVAEQDLQYLAKSEIEKRIREKRKQMEEAAKSLDFIMAAQLRDEITVLKAQLQKNKKL